LLNPLYSFHFYNNINCRIKSTFNLPNKSFQQFGLSIPIISGDKGVGSSYAQGTIGKHLGIYTTSDNHTYTYDTEHTGSTVIIPSYAQAVGLFADTSSVTDSDVIFCIRY
jgi:hypothetical protein